MVRGRDACWEHCVLVDGARQKVRCNYCHREFSGGVYRMKFHLAQIRNKDIVPCTEVPNNVRDVIQGILSTPRKQKASRRQKVEHVANGQENSSSASGGAHPNRGSSEQNGSFCPSLWSPHASPSAQPEPTVYDIRNEKQDNADKKIALFFFYNAIPFSAATSTYYQEMVDAIAECGLGYKAPTSEKLRCNLLEKVKADVNDTYKNLRYKWQETGCTILCNCWPKISSYVANFLSLRFLVLQEENLKHMFSHTEWLASSASRRPDAQLIKSMLNAEQFWSSAREAVSISEPLVKIRRILEGDMPAMGYLYEGIERAKISIKTYYNGITERYMPIWDIIERRWNMHFTSPLHSAAAFLNPSIFYGLSFKADLRMRNGFQEAMMKLATKDTDKIEITKEHPVYVNAHGALGTEFATKGRTLNAPEWPSESEILFPLLDDSLLENDGMLAAPVQAAPATVQAAPATVQAAHFPSEGALALLSCISSPVDSRGDMGNMGNQVQLLATDEPTLPFRNLATLFPVRLQMGNEQLERVQELLERVKLPIERGTSGFNFKKCLREVLFLLRAERKMRICSLNGIIRS
ncbi:hypothetical protein DH2020_028613 [Rehmannia glutinosa]|uniref:BED-type domain-containing protein n=1 Tax=Rehmannia glutinosa TaxID=99300 RepID=A0ABR0VR14_REHGL